MSKPFDATTKELLESDPRAWLELLLGRKVNDVRVLNVDLSTITTEADSVLLVEETEPWLVHVEFQAGYEAHLPLRIQRYNILVHYREGLPVQSIVLLLRPEADGPAMSGLLQHRLPDGSLYHEFRYNVVRIWERPVEEILAGGLATLPLAPIADVSQEELPDLVRKINQRIRQETNPSQAATLWTAAFILMGLVYPEEFIERLFQGISVMEESVTYQAILRKGRAEGLAEGRANEAKRILNRQASRRFGPPGPALEARIDAIDDLERLEELIDRIQEVPGWDALLGETVNESA